MNNQLDNNKSIVLTAKEDLTPLYFVADNKPADEHTIRIDFGLTNRSIDITNLLYSYNNTRGMFLESVLDTLIADLSKKTVAIQDDSCAASQNYVKTNRTIISLLEQAKATQEEAFTYACNANNEEMKDVWIKEYLTDNKTDEAKQLTVEELNEMYYESLSSASTKTSPFLSVWLNGFNSDKETTAQPSLVEINEMYIKAQKSL